MDVQQTQPSVLQTVGKSSSSSALPSPDTQAGWLESVGAAQDREAFTDLFDYFGPRVKAYLLRLGADALSAEEVTQDVMVTVWRKAHLFDRSKSSAATWLFRIARNRRIDLLRRRRDIETDPETLIIEDESLPDPNSMLDEEKRQGRIREALTKLPKEQLKLIELAFFSELSHSQIAEQTDLPLGTVKSRIRLAFGRLRRILEEDSEVDQPGA